MKGSDYVNILIYLAIGLIMYILAYRYYCRYIAGVFDENDNNVTPAIELKDGLDYMPTPPGVVFSHQFASIAGAGPIVGPTTALLFGFMPVWLWVILGAVFIGAVHDYTTLFTSLRERGSSVAEVTRTTLGRWGFFLIIAFTIVMLFLVTSSFLGLTATSLTSMVPVEHMMLTGNTVLKTFVNAEGVEMAKIGGIASTSVIILTFSAPVIGWLIHKRGMKIRYVSLVALVLGVLSVLVGLVIPVTFDPKVWIIILTVYVVIASTIPVWLLLQPRDFMNSFILYIGIALLLVGIIGSGLTGAHIQAPAMNIGVGDAKLGMIWPFLFITVACGAVSGFHALVSTGTVSKQVNKESEARMIGFGGMLLEGVLALVVVICVSTGLSFDQYLQIVWPAEGAANPILAFSLSMGYLLHNALGLPVAFGAVFGILMVEGFVVTTLDTAVRLNRYLLQELWKILFFRCPKWLLSPLFNSLLAAAVMLFLAWTNTFQLIWPIFGASNQLMASLSLLAVTFWLLVRKKPTWFTFLPALFMVATSMTTLYLLLVNKYLPTGNVPLIVTDFLLMGLSLGIIALSIQKYISFRREA